MQSAPAPVRVWSLFASVKCKLLIVCCCCPGRKLQVELPLTSDVQRVARVQPSGPPVLYVNINYISCKWYHFGPFEWLIHTHRIYLLSSGGTLSQCIQNSHSCYYNLLWCDPNANVPTRPVAETGWCKGHGPFIGQSYRKYVLLLCYVVFRDLKLWCQSCVPQLVWAFLTCVSMKDALLCAAGINPG